ncbi:DarT ssDNA thymidine ADP-ribosyltransferase family protein [Streptomyces sp. NRRL S-378]|uniref:DarT ssDNA thymidine ADP-ribosyltransferase family protein n=1 Tax=Streptomyces sp. NRRL S-378 TaxID=1463904 RepID=UPI00068A6DD2|nr:DarT ssDNA thymidine ADP-ribosyltransferase family protein [Streptomyces sp. NRRL S-378]
MTSTQDAAETKDTVESIIASRKISEALHFTTNLGLLGILGTSAVLSRRQLPSEKYVEHIYTPNCSTRKDHAWLDYVNLSISRINDSMFDASKRWHEVDKVWWAALSFEAQILSAPGVYFTTTNNIYPSVRRGTGADGLNALFAEVISGRYSQPVMRRAGQPTSWTTDRQAEVLYPSRLPLAQLQRIYVREEHHADDISGWFASFPSTPTVPVICAPKVFT